jgi:hypothetical protein
MSIRDNPPTIEGGKMLAAAPEAAREGVGGGGAVAARVERLSILTITCTSYRCHVLALLAVGVVSGGGGGGGGGGPQKKKHDI